MIKPRTADDSPDEKQSMDRTWAVFSDATACEICLFRLERDDAKGITLKGVGMIDKAGKLSAERAITSVNHILIQKKRIVNKSFDISYEYNGTVQAVQASASLAFGLKLVQLVEGLHFPIAATGVVPNSLPAAPVEKINCINEKATAAIDRLKTTTVNPDISARGIFFYPQQNDEEISEAIREYAKTNQVRLAPITTVKEAVDILVADAPQQPVARSWRRRGLLGLLLLIAAAIFFVFFPVGKHQIAMNIKGNNPSAVVEIQKALENRLISFGIAVDGGEPRGTLAAEMNIIEQEEIPLFPHATPEATIIRAIFVLDGLYYETPHNRRYPMVEAVRLRVDLPKNKESDLYVLASNLLIQDLEKKEVFKKINAIVKDADPIEIHR